MTARNRLRAAARSLLLVAGACMVVTPAQADAGWFDSGDTQLRLDLQLLNDAEIIRYPTSQWPIPRPALQYAIAGAKEHFATNSSVAAALERVRARVAPPRSALAFDTGVSGGSPGLWRDFDTLAREDGEFGAAMRYDSGRFSAG